MKCFTNPNMKRNNKGFLIGRTWIKAKKIATQYAPTKIASIE